MLDGILAHCVQKSEMELDYSGHLQTGDAELLMPESCYSDVKLKFISLSQVLKVTATQQPTIALRQGLHIQQRIGKPQGSSTEFLIMKRLQHHPTLQGLKQESSCLKWIARCSVSSFQDSTTGTTASEVRNLNLLHGGRKEAFGVIECWVLSETVTVSVSVQWGKKTIA